MGFCQNKKNNNNKMEDSSLVRDASHDIIQPLLTPSNSSMLERSLESLIEASRNTNGRTDLASKNIIHTVLDLIKHLHNHSNFTPLVSSLKLLRNLCAGEINNQTVFIKQHGVGILSTILHHFGAKSNQDHGIVRTGLQALANVSLAGQEHQLAIWNQFFPDLFIVLARLRCYETCDPLCKVIYTCCDGCPELIVKLCSDCGFSIVKEIIQTAASVGYDDIECLLSRIFFGEHHSPQMLTKEVVSKDRPFLCEQAFLLRIMSKILNENIEKFTVTYDFAMHVFEIFKSSVKVVDFAPGGKCALPTGKNEIDVLGYSLTILRDICARDRLENQEEESQDTVYVLLSSGLIEMLLSMLHDLEPPAIIKRIVEGAENQDQTGTNLSKFCPYKGFRRDIVAVIGNCLYRRKYAQEKFGKEGILLLLQQCVSDENNPFLREWGIWSVRNLLEGNVENQRVVAELELQGSVDVPEITNLGLRVEVDPKTGRARLVNIS